MYLYNYTNRIIPNSKRFAEGASYRSYKEFSDGDLLVFNINITIILIGQVHICDF